MDFVLRLACVLSEFGTGLVRVWLVWVGMGWYGFAMGLVRVCYGFAMGLLWSLIWFCICLVWVGMDFVLRLACVLSEFGTGLVRVWLVWVGMGWYGFGLGFV